MSVEQHGTPTKILKWRPAGRRLKGRPRKKWIEDIEEDLKKIGIKTWRRICNNRAEWRKIIEEAETHSGL